MTLALPRIGENIYTAQMSHQRPSPEEIAPTLYHDVQTFVDPLTGKPLDGDCKTMADRPWLTAHGCQVST